MILKYRNALGFDFTALTHLCFSLDPDLYSTTKHLFLALVLRSNRQHAHRFLLENLNPLNHSKIPHTVRGVLYIHEHSWTHRNINFIIFSSITVLL